MQRAAVASGLLLGKGILLCSKLRLLRLQVSHLLLLGGSLLLLRRFFL